MDRFTGWCAVAFEEPESQYTLSARVFVTFDVVLSKGVAALL